MQNRYTLVHKTIYSYEWEALESYSKVKVSPLETICQSVNSHVIEVKPDVPVYSHRDYFGNLVHEFSVPFRHKTLEITATSDVTTYVPSLEAQRSEITIREAIKWFKNYEYDFYDYVNESPFIKFTPTVLDFAKKVLDPDRKLSEAVWDLNQMFTKDFKYSSGSTQINTPVDDVILKREGVCQDFSHTMISLLRATGIAARYVSGYIETYDPTTNPGMIGSEQSHAWLDVYMPDFSWYGLDPTNNMYSSEKHIRVGMGRDFDDISPVRGTFKGSGRQTLSVEVYMRRIVKEVPFLKLQSSS
jgi:transglutaminase-like putative cysteine protease